MCPSKPMPGIDMIHFNPSTRTFNLILQHSTYASHVDKQDRVVHLGWAPRPPDAAPEDLLSRDPAYAVHETPYSFITQFRPDEILAFGDVTIYHVTLKASFPSLAEPLQAG